jgi:hypothetical protein
MPSKPVVCSFMSAMTPHPGIAVGVSGVTVVAEALLAVHLGGHVAGEQPDEAVATGDLRSLGGEPLENGAAEPLPAVVGVDGYVLNVEIESTITDHPAHPDDLALELDGHGAADGPGDRRLHRVPAEDVAPADCLGQGAMFSERGDAVDQLAGHEV